MDLNLKGFAALVSQHVTAVQAEFAGLANATEGSINLALAQASASGGLWLQALAFKLLLFARASTSFGTDLDSWLAQFGVFRLGAVAAGGLVTFGRFSAFASLTIIPVGAIVATADGLFFRVAADSTNPAWTPAVDGYTLGEGVLSLAVPVVCTTPGAIGNVLAGYVNVTKTAISAVDYVSNAGPFIGGVDAENDPAARTRFVAFINSLSKGTAGAITYAIMSLQLGLQFTLTERQEYADPLKVKNGFFYIVFDDGSGAPSDALRDRVYAAVDAVRAFGIEIAVFKTVVRDVPISMLVQVAAGYDSNATVGQVYQAVALFVGTLPIGATLSYFQLAQVAFNASPGVVNISNLRVNYGVDDVLGDVRHTIKARVISVSASA